MKKEYEIRPYHHGDEDEIVQLLELVFDGWPKFDLSCTSIDHWRWKYLDNPFKTKFIVLGTSDHRIIGVIHSVPMRIIIGDESFFSAYAGDVVVHPTFRRKGVNSKMRTYVIESFRAAGIKTYFSVTDNPVVIRWWTRMGVPRFPHKITNLVNIKCINKQLQAMPVKNAWLMKLGFNVAKIINNIRNAIERFEPDDIDKCIHEIHRFDDRIDVFWKEVSDHHKFIIERNKNYLNWRYCDPRAGDFVVKQAEDCEGRVLGYCVLRINRYLREYPIGYFIDLLTLPDRLDVAYQLVGEAVRYFDRQDINIVNALMVKHHPYEKVLKSFGFLDSRIKLQLFLSPLEKVDKLKKLETDPTYKIHFSYGDIDSLPTTMPDNM